MPPASNRPVIARICTATKGEGDPEQRRRTDADDDRLAAHRMRQAGRGETDDHRVVAGQHQIDHDHLEQRAERSGFGKKGQNIRS